MHRFVSWEEGWSYVTKYLISDNFLPGHEVTQLSAEVVLRTYVADGHRALRPGVTTGWAGRYFAFAEVIPRFVVR